MKRPSEDNLLLEAAYGAVAKQPTPTPEQCMRDFGQVMITLENMIQHQVPVDAKFKETAMRMINAITNKIQDLPRSRR